MKYFAKFLPIEGECKRGELGWGLNDCTCLYNENLPEGYCKPIQLFLCIKDIRIGPISLEAIWIKEGDEFEEDQIKRDILTKWYAGEDDYTEFCHYHPKGDEKFNLSSDSEFIAEYPIKIQCPICKTFH